MSYGVLIGAMVGALVFWLIVDVFCYDTFHGAAQITSEVSVQPGAII